MKQELTALHKINRYAQEGRHLPVGLSSWKDIEEWTRHDKPLMPEDVLSKEELVSCKRYLQDLRKEYDRTNSLDRTDVLVATLSGALAGCVHIFFIGQPRFDGVMGGPSSKDGPFSNWVRDKLQTIKTKEIKVPYDAQHNKYTGQRIEGLSPKSHRFHSLGHDPLLGLFFGTRDVLKGQFTTVDKFGNYVSQKSMLGDGGGMDIFSALAQMLRHNLSDLPTPMGLPVPGAALSQFLQFGNFGEKNRTVAEVVRGMYTYGNYDFAHFSSMAVAPMLVEVIVRMYFAGRIRYEGGSWKECLPVGDKPRLKTMLCLAHATACAVNAGQLAITQNPLDINYPQWLALLWHALPTLRHHLFDKGCERERHVERHLDHDFDQILSELDAVLDGKTKLSNAHSLGKAPSNPQTT